MPAVEDTATVPPAMTGERLAERIAREADAVSSTPVFARAPVMRRLLRFLVTETLAGRGEQLKAYSVAVDGLGRPPDFDAQGDSYPRVQVGRLRRMLDGHYGLHPSTDGIRLNIPNGQYRVSFTESPPDALPAAPAPLSKERVAHLRHPAATIVAAICGGVALLALILGLGMLLVRPGDKPAFLVAANQLEPPPVLDLRSLKRPEIDSDTGDAVRSILLDALRRSWVVQVSASTESSPVPSDARYQLVSDLGGGAKPTLFLALWRLGPDRLIWSERVVLPEDPEKIPAALAPLAAALVQPLGVIASHERADRGANAAPGYPCLLRVAVYRLDRSPELHRESKRCLERTIALDPANDVALAVASMLALDEPVHSRGRGRAKIERARALAARAIAANPFSANGHLALAKIALVRGNCPATVNSALKAAELNPFDPIIQIQTSIYLMNCGDPRAEAHARRALEFDSGDSVLSYVPLVYIAIDRGDARAAREAAEMILVRHDPRAATFWLTIAIAEAAGGQNGRAREAWQQLAATGHPNAHDPEAMLARWHFAPRLRAKAIAHLVRAGLIAPRN
jgi:hypothetical protein